MGEGCDQMQTRPGDIYDRALDYGATGPSESAARPAIDIPVHNHLQKLTVRPLVKQNRTGRSHPARSVRHQGQSSRLHPEHNELGLII